jgi:hypothetical protein
MHVVNGAMLGELVEELVEQVTALTASFLKHLEQI